MSVAGKGHLLILLTIENLLIKCIYPLITNSAHRGYSMR